MSCTWASMNYAYALYSVVNYIRYHLRIVMTNVIPPQDASNPTTHPVRQHSEIPRLYKHTRRSYRTHSSTNMLRTTQGYVTQSLYIIRFLVHTFCMYVQTCIPCLQCRDTFWIESFNHQLLTYIPKACPLWGSGIQDEDGFCST